MIIKSHQKGLRSGCVFLMQQIGGRKPDTAGRVSMEWFDVVKKVVASKTKAFAVNVNGVKTND